LHKNVYFHLALFIYLLLADEWQRTSDIIQINTINMKASSYPIDMHARLFSINTSRGESYKNTSWILLGADPPLHIHIQISE
jgi:hypothetical protein